MQPRPRPVARGVEQYHRTGQTSKGKAPRESVPTFRWGRPPKNIYAKNVEEQVSQREWDTLNDQVRRAGVLRVAGGASLRETAS